MVEELTDRRRWVLPFNRTKTEVDTIADIVRETKKNVHPLLFIPDTSGSDVYFVRIVSDVNIVIPYPGQMTLELVEESRGKPIVAAQPLIFFPGDTITGETFTRTGTAKQLNSPAALIVS